MELTWYGHSVVMLYDGTTRIIIDPFISGNPCKFFTDDLSTLPKIDYVLLTHDHDDHVGDTIEIALKHNAKVAGVFENLLALQKKGLPTEHIYNGMGFNIGGTIQLGSFSILMIPAFHTSFTGAPVGYIITSHHMRIYYTGDTAPFGDMQMWTQLFPIHTLCVPIGGYFTADAILARHIVHLTQPKNVLPMHFGTFPILEETTNAFQTTMEDMPNVNLLLPKPCEAIHLS